MYLPQPAPEQELIVLPFEDRIEVMATENAIRYKAARAALLDDRPHLVPAALDEQIAMIDHLLVGYIERETESAEAQQR